jgi:hypothetical protein
MLWAPVCGCQGFVASNQCDAYAAGVDLDAEGNCKPADGTFSCGSSLCIVPGFYCEHSVSDVGGTPDGFTCKPTPPACTTAPSCGCLKNEPCGDWCSADAMGDWTLTCPGG